VGADSERDCKQGCPDRNDQNEEIEVPH
jgi:hypothetical protein